MLSDSSPLPLPLPLPISLSTQPTMHQFLCHMLNFTPTRQKSKFISVPHQPHEPHLTTPPSVLVGLVRTWWGCRGEVCWDAAPIIICLCFISADIEHYCCRYFYQGNVISYAEKLYRPFFFRPSKRPSSVVSGVSTGRKVVRCLEDRVGDLALKGLPHCWGGGCDWLSEVVLLRKEFRDNAVGGDVLALSYLITPTSPCRISDQVR